MEKATYRDFIPKLQTLVADEINQVGGYWPVDVALAVTGEHFGDATEKLLADEKDGYSLFMSHALWVLTCISNQYCCDLDRSASKIWSEENDLTGEHDALLVAFREYGRILRIVNRYEHGIYTDRRSNESVTDVIVRTHRAIITGIEQAGGDIDALVKKRVELVRSFKGNPDIPEDTPRTDPTIGESNLRFSKLSNTTTCPFAPSVKFWATEPWMRRTGAAEFARKNQRTFERFSRVCQPEGFDGIVVEAFGIEDMEQLKERTRDLLETLGPFSPRNPMSSPIDRKEWRFSLFGIDVFVTTFSSIYDKEHPRFSHSGASTFFFFQPQISFKAKAAKEKNNIRRRFAEIGQDYSGILGKVRCEGHKYIKPENLNEDPPVIWWEQS